jgi:hypothetical protein
MLWTHLAVDELVLQHSRLLQQLRSYQSQKNEFLKTAALFLRQEIQEFGVMMQSKEITVNSDFIQLPQTVQEFLTLILQGDDMLEPSSRIKRLATSFTQDLINAVSRGKIKMPKHILLPHVVKTLTSNVEIIILLNRLGHGLSYHQLEEIETSIASQKIATHEDSRVALPSTISPNLFTHLAWDNIDRLEETLSGAGTTHRINGIIVQQQTLGPVTKIDSTCLHMQKQRTFSASEIIEPVIMGHYDTKNRVGPNLDFCAERQGVELSDAKAKNLLWISMRSANFDQPQTICSWTGFNIQMRKNRETVQSRIEYLPTLDSPPSSLSTAREILQRSLLIMKNLNLPSIVCTFDQALFAKAAKIAWKYPDEYSPIVLNLGGFHLICNYMSIIGKRYEDAGLKDILIESGATAEGSASGILSGKHYNRGVRAHKLMYEALMRLVFHSFPDWIDEHYLPNSIAIKQTIRKLEHLTDADTDEWESK